MKVNKAAQALGRMGKGKPKNYTKAERARRAERMRIINERKKNTAAKSESQKPDG